MAHHTELIGAHVSIAGGLWKAFERAEAIGATALQIFTKSNRQWRAKPLSEEDITKFHTAWKESSIQSVIAHAAYLINLGSAQHAIVEKSIEALAEELQRCEALHIPYLVLHPGTAAYPDDLEKSLQYIAHHIDAAFKKSGTKKVHLLLETMAGQGSTLGNTFEQLAAIIRHSTHKARLGICFDTCHVFVAGYSFQNATEYKAMMKTFDTTIGLHHIKAIHINDSKKQCGSRVDRHEHIGKGALSHDAFSLLLKDHHFAQVPKILETPKDDDHELESDIRNIDMLYKLRAQ